MNDYTQTVADRAIAERERQKNELGYDAESGKYWKGGELADAGFFYILTPQMRESVKSHDGTPIWPFDGHYFKPDITGTNLGRLRELEKGVALALAEMERIYGLAYDTIPDIEPDGVNYTQWVEAVKGYIVLERQYGWDITTPEELAGLVNPDSQDWQDLYNAQYTARGAYEAMYYEH